MKLNELQAIGIITIATCFSLLVNGAFVVEEPKDVADANHRNATCFNNYGERRYFSKGKEYNPPLLYTFPGSGNTWARQLIEFSTGVYTGSVYNDHSLFELLPGEEKCNHYVVAVKAHPFTHTFTSLSSGRFKSDAQKCNKGNMLKFSRAIFLLRDPFDAIWSDYQRYVAVMLKNTEASHVSGIPQSKFYWSDWRRFAHSMAVWYADMIRRQYAQMQTAYGNSNILYVYFEQLRSKNTRMEALRNITDFLGFNPSNERLECAFTMSEQAVRTIDPDMVRKEDAYIPTIVCHIWGLVKSVALPHNYSIYNNTSCFDVPALQDYRGKSYVYKPRPKGKTTVSAAVSSPKPQPASKQANTLRTTTLRASHRDRSRAVGRQGQAAYPSAN